MPSWQSKLLMLLAPERAHRVALKLLRYLPIGQMKVGIDLAPYQQTLMGLNFPHPLCLAAGFDRNAEVFDKLANLNFAAIEVGSFTLEPQPGNPLPRIFRLPEHEAIINRIGFASKGVDYGVENLKRYPKKSILGANLGKNKNSTNELVDYVECGRKLLPYVDYLVVNVSSPNTVGLRGLQNPELLKPIIDAMLAMMQQQNRKIPLLVKLAPDMESAQESELLHYLVESGVSGLIISNTTLSRPGQISDEAGGLSGAPLRDLAASMLQRAYKITRGKLTLIACGGISTGQDAYQRLCQGADLLQIYTGFIYQGPQVVQKILRELDVIMEKHGIASLKALPRR